MSKSTPTLLQLFSEKSRVLRAFASAQALLSWDSETWLPKGAAADRGETLSILGGFSHQLFTDPAFVRVVEELHERTADLSAIDARAVALAYRDLRNSLKLPQTFVEETQTLIHAANTVWGEAKRTGEFARFSPWLEKIVANRRQYATYIDETKNPYNVLLDEYEEDLTEAELDPLFSSLQAGIQTLLPKILRHQAAQKRTAQTLSPFDRQTLEKGSLQTVLQKMAKQIGFDWERGALGEVEHPFETSISANDVRINTHFEKTHNSFTITGLIHELGHGLYEQNIDPKYFPSLFLCRGVSLGIHESQSRLLENMIGRSQPFWQYFLPVFQKHFPELQNYAVEEVVQSLCAVQPSLIRTEADEVTYNLHIALRYEIEKGLIHGSMRVADLPEIWRTKMHAVFQIVPENDRDGVLQDVHWSWGNFGYFPTYTLGNLNAAQLWHAFVQAHPGWESRIASGDFSSYFSWFKEHVWQHGSLFSPAEIMKNATGETTQASHFLTYLEAKYLA